MITISSESNHRTFGNSLKIIVISTDKNVSHEQSKLLSGTTKSENSSTGTYHGFIKDLKIVTYSRIPKTSTENQATVAVDAIVMFINSEEEYALIKQDIEDNFKYVLNRIIITNGNKVSRWDKELSSVTLDSSSSNADVINSILGYDREEYIRIRQVFSKYDSNNSNSLDLKELPSLIKDLGVNPDLKEVQNAILALDINHDKEIDFNEFIQWWKIGRQNSKALAKIYQLNIETNKLINQLFDFPKLTSESLTNQGENKTKLSFNLKTHSEELRYTTRLNLKLSAGGELRREATKNFLSRYTNIHTKVDNNWINLSFFVRSLTYQGSQIKDFLENFRKKLIKYAEDNFISGLSEFIRDFVIFKFYSQDYAATITFEFKEDVYEIVKDALENFNLIRNYITNNMQASFDFDLKVISEDHLADSIKEDRTIEDFLNKAEVSIASTGLKERLEILLMNLREDYNKYLPLLQFLFAPKNLKVNQTSSFSSSLLGRVHSISNVKLSLLRPIFDFIKGNLDQDLLNVLSRIELGVNMYDTFFEVQSFSNEQIVRD